MLTLGGILSLHEIPDWLPELKNVTRASFDTVESSKWVKFQFGANYPFNLKSKRGHFLERKYLIYVWRGFFFPILCESDMYIVLEKTCSNVMKNKQERQDGLSLKQKLFQWFLSHGAQSSNNSEGVKKKRERDPHPGENG